ERSVHSIFRIPTTAKQPSRSPAPQGVTSSTQHDNEQQHYQENNRPPPQLAVAQPTSAQLQPVENGFPMYGSPEQVQSPQQQYRASTANMFQP
ncbi:hypothetical protein pipiens_013317, partial [Culex pipiens pipiens]